MTSGGRAYERPTWEHLTDGIGGLLLPTPVAGDGKAARNATAIRSPASAHHHSGTTLTDAARMLPTPRASDGPHGGPGQTGDGLQPALRYLPTPRASTSRTSRGAMVEAAQWATPGLEQVAELASGQLPPEFETWEELPGASKLFATPDASLSNDGEDPETWEARRAAAQQRLGNGNGFGTPLAMQVQMLPTPQAREGDPRRGHPSAETAQQRMDDGRRNLDDAVALLPTPASWDGARGPDYARQRDRQATGSGGDDLVTTVAKLLPTPTGDDANNTTRASGSFGPYLSREAHQLWQGDPSTGDRTPPQSPDGST